MDPRLLRHVIIGIIVYDKGHATQIDVYDLVH